MGVPSGEAWKPPWLGPDIPFSPAGNGLFLVLSFSVVVEEVGVPWAEVLGELCIARWTKCGARARGG